MSTNSFNVGQVPPLGFRGQGDRQRPARPHSLINWIQPNVTFSDRLKQMEDAHDRAIAQRRKELEERKEALNKEKLILLTNKKRMDHQIAEQQALHQVYVETAKKRQKEVRAERERVKQDIKELKQIKAVKQAEVRVIESIFSEFDQEIAEFAQQRKHRKSSAGSADSPTSSVDPDPTLEFQ